MVATSAIHIFQYQRHGHCTKWRYWCQSLLYTVQCIRIFAAHYWNIMKWWERATATECSYLFSFCGQCYQRMPLNMYETPHFQNQRYMVTASHQLNILVSVITIHCSVHTHIMQHMMRKSNCNRMQLLILILWPVLSEDVIKHVWYPMVAKSQEHEHNCNMHQLWSMRKYCRITPSFIPRSSQSLSLTLCKSIGKAWDVPTT